MRETTACLFGLCVLAALPGQSVAQGSPADTALVRRLAIEVQEFVRARPGVSRLDVRDENERITDLLVPLQVRARDVNGAFATATTLMGSVLSFQVIADYQRQIGDHAGLLATVAMSRDRAALTSFVVQGYIGLDSLNLAADHARRLPAGAVRRQLESNIAIARVGHGDWSGIDGLLADSVSPADQAELLTGLAEHLRMSGAPQFDSVARLAAEATARIKDSVEHEQALMMLNLRVRQLRAPGTVMMVNGPDGVIFTLSSMDTATTGPGRIQALRNRAIAEARRDRNLVTALQTLADSQVVSDNRSLAGALVDIAAVVANLPVPPPVDLDSTWLHTLTRAVSTGDRVDSSFADLTRVRVIGLLAPRDIALARQLTTEIRSEPARTRAQAIIIRRDMTGNIHLAIAEANALRPATVADTILREAVARQLSGGLFQDATATMGLIANPGIRRMTGVDVALAQQASGHRDEAIRGLNEALTALDPWRDYGYVSRTVLPSLLAMRQTTQVVQWARSKVGVQGAYARMAVMAAILSSPARGPGER